jgi:hypothetical protein
LFGILIGNMATKNLEVEAADENTPLLTTEPAITAGPEAEVRRYDGKIAVNGGERAVERDADEDEDRPLPKLQIVLLCFARLIEPMAFFGIFPFVNKMIQELGGLAEADVGFYSGLIVSSFFEDFFGWFEVLRGRSRRGERS